MLNYKKTKLMDKKDLYEFVLNYFEKTMPKPETELKYKNPYELIVAVMLSAQCTDVRVNKITPEFFRHFPTPQSLAQAKSEQVYELIKTCSYPNNKTKYLIKMARMIIQEFKGQIPENFEDLQKLPGIGRKSANVLAAIIHKQPRIAVDTHVFRVSNRIGLTDNSKTPLQTEKELIKYIPKEKRLKAHHWLILHGRYTCTARKPKCDKCGLKEICKYYNSTKTNLK